MVNDKPLFFSNKIAIDQFDLLYLFMNPPSLFDLFMNVCHCIFLLDGKINKNSWIYMCFKDPVKYFEIHRLYIQAPMSSNAISMWRILQIDVLHVLHLASYEGYMKCWYVVFRIKMLIYDPHVLYCSNLMFLLYSSLAFLWWSITLFLSSKFGVGHMGKGLDLTNHLPTCTIKDRHIPLSMSAVEATVIRGHSIWFEKHHLF